LQAKDVARAERWFQRALQQGLKPDLLEAQEKARKSQTNPDE